MNINFASNMAAKSSFHRKFPEKPPKCMYYSLHRVASVPFAVVEHVVPPAVFVDPSKKVM